jgi:hypothetical protein
MKVPTLGVDGKMKALGYVPVLRGPAEWTRDASAQARMTSPLDSEQANISVIPSVQRWANR